MNNLKLKNVGDDYNVNIVTETETFTSEDTFIEDRRKDFPDEIQNLEEA